MNNFPYSIDNLLIHEGGYINDPVDPGGETNFGISKRMYPSEDIKNLSKDRAKVLYFNDYWLKNNLDKITDKDIASAALDTVVNHGRGGYLLQKALQSTGAPVSTDGKIGPDTLKFINATAPKTFLSALYDVRKAYYENLVSESPNKSKFLTGWLSRIEQWKGSNNAIGMLLALGAAIYFLLKKRQA